MWVSRLQIETLRCFSAVSVLPATGLNILTGANGAGKSTVLEALSLLGSGRSFRGGARAPLVRKGENYLSVFAEVESARGTQRIGFSRSASSWSAKLNGAAVTSLAKLVRELPILVLEPGSHSLVEGPSESRRRLFDWFLFHVEPGFSGAAARYQRALQQRNAILKQDAVAIKSLAVWNQQLAETGTVLSGYREREWVQLEPIMRATFNSLLPELGSASVTFNRGWSNDVSLLDAIEDRERVDVSRGFSSRGPHRADWFSNFALVSDRLWLSRGQEKNAYLAYAMAFLQRYRSISGESAILCIDDIWSELDELHQARCFALAANSAGQVWVTGTEQRASSNAWTRDSRLFHVEHGAISIL